MGSPPLAHQQFEHQITDIQTALFLLLGSDPLPEEHVRMERALIIVAVELKGRIRLTEIFALAALSSEVSLRPPV